MADRGIIFSAPMITALLAGRKTQTRRLAESPLARSRPGDRLWVREAHRHWSAGHDAEISYPADGASFHTGPNTGQIPDASLAAYFKRCDRSRAAGKAMGYPSIHMPRWASRLTLIVDQIRFEPLAAISEADAQAEGMPEPYLGDADPPFEEQAIIVSRRRQFRNLWNALHDKAGQRWADNPDVVALTFRVIRGNIDRLPETAHG